MEKILSKVKSVFDMRYLANLLRDSEPVLLEGVNKENKNIAGLRSEEIHKKSLLAMYCKAIICSTSLIQVSNIASAILLKNAEILIYSVGNLSMIFVMLLCLRLSAKGYSKLASLILITVSTVIWSIMIIPSQSIELDMLGFIVITLMAFSLLNITFTVCLSVYAVVYSIICVSLIPDNLKIYVPTNILMGVTIYVVLIAMLLIPIRQRYKLLYGAVKHREELFQMVSHARDQERLKFWDVLHSRVIFALTQVRQISSTSSLQNENAQLKTIIGEAEKEAREMLSTLSPDLIDVGLEIALERLIKEHSKAPLHIELNYGVFTRLPDTLNYAVYRIVREALRNIVQHSKADRASVDVWEGNGKITLQIRDNGIGFTVPDSAEQLSRNHGGLLIVYERCAALGASLRISSIRGCTEINISITYDDVEVEADARKEEKKGEDYATI
jgi:signal transduction histidine kinase